MHRRYHEALQNVTPADMFTAGRPPSWRDARGSSGARIQQGKRKNVHRPHTRGHSLRGVSVKSRQTV